MLYFGASEEHEQTKRVNPLYLYNSDTKELKPQSFGKKKIPSKRFNHTFTTAWDSSLNKAYVVGGSTTKGPMKEVYEVNLATQEFTLL